MQEINGEGEARAMVKPGCGAFSVLAERLWLVRCLGAVAGDLVLLGRTGVSCSVWSSFPEGRLSLLPLDCIHSLTIIAVNLLRHILCIVLLKTTATNDTNHLEDCYY